MKKIEFIILGIIVLGLEALIVCLSIGRFQYNAPIMRASGYYPTYVLLTIFIGVLFATACVVMDILFVMEIFKKEEE